MSKRRRRPLGLLLVLLLLSCAGAQAELPTGAQNLAPESYRDVPREHWALDAIRRLSTLGVLTGYPDQTFRGEQFATRYELAVVAARLVDLIGGSLADLALDPTFWRDVDRVAQMLDRFTRLEQAVAQTASNEELRRLERRVRDMEEFINGLIGEERFPLERQEESTGGALSGAATDPAGSTRSVPAARTDIGAGSRLAPLPQEQGSGAELQQRRALQGWVGVAAGYPQFSTLHVGIRDLLPSLHLRAGLGLGGSGGYAAEVLALLSLPSAPDAPVLPYVGFGPALLGTGSGVAPGGLALAGLEVPLGRSLDAPGLLYLEVGPRVGFDAGVAVDVLGRVGLGYRF